MFIRWQNHEKKAGFSKLFRQICLPKTAYFMEFMLSIEDILQNDDGNDVVLDYFCMKMYYFGIGFWEKVVILQAKYDPKQITV